MTDWFQSSLVFHFAPADYHGTITNVFTKFDDFSPSFVYKFSSKMNLRPASLITMVMIVLTVFSFFSIIGELLCNLIGFVYAAYCTIKAIEGDMKESKKWLCYWMIFSFFLIVEFFTKKILTIVPYYYIIKIMFLVYLMSSKFDGALQIYQNFIFPFVARYESKIDEVLNNIPDSIANVLPSPRHSISKSQ